MTKNKTPMKNLRGRIAFTHSESCDHTDDAAPANPWDRMLRHEERWNRQGPRWMMQADFLTVLVLLGMGAVIIGAVLLLK